MIDKQPRKIQHSEDKNWLFWFRHSSPYINAHRGKTVVLAMGGEALDHTNLTNVIHDIALLNSLGVRLVLVFGARPQIEKTLALAGIESVIHHGLRVTPEAAMPHILAAVGQLRAKLEAQLTTGVVNSPMHGAGIRVMSGNLVTARPVGVLDGVDLCYTGRVRKVDKEGVARLLDHRAIVLLPSIGYSLTGESFNLGFEDVACSVAEAVQADKLIIFAGQGGLEDEQGNLLRELSLKQAEEWVGRMRQTDDSPDQLAELLALSVRAGRKGVKRCHVIDYREDGALINELFTRDGAGTMVYDDEYEQIRSATIEDIAGIQALLIPLEQEGVLVRRSRELLENEIAYFTVDERDGSIIGCAALYPYPADKTGELACFVVSADYRKAGRGDVLLSLIEKQAIAKGIRRLFVLTTQTEHWFRERGFDVGSVADLPEPKRAKYNPQRNSKIFIKTLS